MNNNRSLKDDPIEQPTTGFFHGRAVFPIAVLALVLIQLCLVFYFERPGIIFGSEPISWLDFDTHVEQVWRAIEALDQWGKSWSYDPYLLAGNPNGTIFAADNKGWELWTFVLFKLGVPKGTAFNLFVLLSHLMVPWVAFFSSRLFGLNKWSSFVAALLGLCLWYFDSFPRWLWWCGMISYAISGYLFLLPLALFYRYLKDKRLFHLLLLAVIMSIGHLIHPYIFFILVIPMIVFYLHVITKLSLKEHIGIAGAAIAVVAANAYWLVPSLKNWHYLEECHTGIWAQSGISFVLTDYLGLMNEPIGTGVLDTHTGFRIIVFAGCIICLWRWRKQSDTRFLPFISSFLVLLAITYLGSYVQSISYIQPYRHIMPAMYLAIIPAAALFESVQTSGVLKRLPRLAYAVGGLGLLVIGGNLARDALYFFPASLPDPNLKKEEIIELIRVNPDVPNVWKRQMEFRHAPAFKDFNRVVKWVNQNDKKPGRILVQAEVLGEHLAWRTQSQILGGFRYRNVQHGEANLFRRYAEARYWYGDLSKDQVRQYLIDYAVKWVIFSGPVHEMEHYDDLIQPLGYIKPIHRIYESILPVSFFTEGDGKVTASLNRIRVEDTTPYSDVVLRYHWHEDLICRPGCKILREPVGHDMIGFIRILSPHPKDFVIENGY